MIFKPSSIMVILLLVLTACATLEEYPRCYAVHPPTPEDRIRTDLELEQFASTIEDKRNFSIGYDSLILSTSNKKHGEFKSIWPAIGCVNGRPEDLLLSDPLDNFILGNCKDYLQDVIKESDQKGSTKKTSFARLAEKYDSLVCY